MRHVRALFSFGCAVAVLSSSVLAESLDEQGQRAPLETVQDYDVPPKPVHITSPVYPPGAFEQGVEGTVLIDLVIDKKGRVAEAKVVESIPELDQAALECVRSWRFTPAKKAGRAVATTAKAPVMFRRDKPMDTKL